jgi:hypothetical protein
MDDISGAGTAYSCYFCGVRVAQSLVFWAVFCWILFVFFIFAMPLLRLKAPDYAIGIFKTFFWIESEDTKGVIRIQRRTDKTMAKRKSTKVQTTIYKTYNVYIKLKIEWH